MGAFHLNDFVLIVLYLKYNTFSQKMPTMYMTFSKIKSDFFEYLCYRYKKEIDEDGYLFERFKKQEIVEGANNYIKQLKNNQNK